MSKADKRTTDALNAPFKSASEVIFVADTIRAGRRTMSRDEAASVLGEAADILDIQFKRLDENMKAVAESEIDVSKRTREYISKAKDLAGQLGNALGRIDTVVTKDFSAKLDQLERFVGAMERLDAINQSGRLDAIVTAFTGVKK